MNLFLKSQIKKILDYKLETGEIKSYQLYDSKIHIRKARRSKYTIDISGLPGHLIIRLMQKKIPDPGKTNTETFFKREIRELKLKELVI